jgi:tetratricopeptide (TPR) repeat protein
MSDKSIKEDPIKMHKDASSLMENGNYAEAMPIFEQVAELYYKAQNYFGSAEMNYKAGECAFNLKEYQKSVEYFMKAADISFKKGFDRYGVSALECARDAHKALGNTKDVEELTTRINEFNQKQSQSQTENSDESFSIFS